MFSIPSYECTWDLLIQSLMEFWAINSNAALTFLYLSLGEYMYIIEAFKKN